MPLFELLLLSHYTSMAGKQIYRLTHVRLLYERWPCAPFCSSVHTVFLVDLLSQKPNKRQTSQLEQTVSTLSDKNGQLYSFVHFIHAVCFTFYTKVAHAIPCAYSYPKADDIILLLAAFLFIFFLLRIWMTSGLELYGQLSDVADNGCSLGKTFSVHKSF